MEEAGEIELHGKSEAMAGERNLEKSVKVYEIGCHGKTDRMLGNHRKMIIVKDGGTGVLKEKRVGGVIVHHERRKMAGGIVHHEKRKKLGGSVCLEKKRVTVGEIVHPEKRKIAGVIVAHMMIVVLLEMNVDLAVKKLEVVVIRIVGVISQQLHVWKKTDLGRKMALEKKKLKFCQRKKSLVHHVMLVLVPLLKSGEVSI